MHFRPSFPWSSWAARIVTSRPLSLSVSLSLCVSVCNALFPLALSGLLSFFRSRHDVTALPGFHPIRATPSLSSIFISALLLPSRSLSCNSFFFFFCLPDSPSPLTSLSFATSLPAQECRLSLRPLSPPLPFPSPSISSSSRAQHLLIVIMAIEQQSAAVGAVGEKGVGILSRSQTNRLPGQGEYYR